MAELIAPSGLMSFRTRILRAGGWTFAGHIGAQVLRLGSNLVMTRLLIPQVFGLMALASVLLTGLQLFSDIGLSQGIVQSKRGSDPAYLNTVWTAQILRGALIWAAALLISVGLFLANRLDLLAPGTAYTEPRLPALIAALSFNALIGGLMSTRVALASRNLALGRLTLLELYSQIIAIVVMVLWALVDRSAWALVGGSLVSSLVRVVLSHSYLPGERNRLHWDREAFRDIFHFGKWIFVTSILGFLASNGDRLLLGGLVDARTLGLYVTGYFMVNALMEIFNKVFNNVAYPALSEVVRERPHDLLKTYYKFRAPVDAASLLTTGFMVTAGHLIIDVLYDHRYHAAGHMLEILSISLFEIRLALTGSSLVALGKPKLLALIIAAQVVVLFGVMPWVFKSSGFDAALWVIGGSVLSTMPVTYVLAIRYGLFDLKRELMFLPCLLLGCLLGFAANGVARLLGIAP